jgi:trimeric autotransporter adhesin
MNDKQWLPLPMRRLWMIAFLSLLCFVQVQAQGFASTESKIDGKRAIIGRLKKDQTRQLLETRVNARLAYKQANDRPTQQQRFYSNIEQFKRPNITQRQSFGKNGAELQSVAWDGSFNIPNLDVGSTVYAMTVAANDEIVICADFVNDLGEYSSNIARWDGQRWNLLGEGTNGIVNAIAIVGSNIYVGGQFTTIGGVSARNLARWDGQRWNAVGQGATNGTDAVVNTLLALGSTLYIGGSFAQAGTITNANGIAALNLQSQTWSALRSATASGVDGAVYALAANGSNLLVGGDFIKAGTLDANSIAQWNVATSTWQTFGTGTNVGIDGIVYTLAVTANTIFAGGEFTKAGGRDASNVARWGIASQAWSALGSGANDVVRSIVSNDGNNCIIGGDFSSCGSKAVNYIASWNGSAWLEYRSNSGITSNGEVGMDAPVYCLAQNRNALLLGGDFFLYNEQNDISGSYIASWNTSTGFSSLGGGLIYGIYAIAVSGSDVYVGGDFSAIGGVQAKNIARWDGRRWNAVGAGTDGAIYALALNGTSLFAGGEFARAGTVRTSNIARLNISTGVWSAMGNRLYL